MAVMKNYTKGGIILANAKGKLLKYKKYDENGLLKVRVFHDHYIGKDEETGELVRVDTKVRKRPGNNKKGNPAFVNHPKARTGGFDKNPQNIYTGNVGQKIVKDKKLKREAGIYWKENQRECLKTLMAMERKEMFIYAVFWGLITREECVRAYRIDVQESDFAYIDQSEPTMLQIVSCTMVLTAQSSAKFGMDILGVLEGKAVSVAQLDAVKKKGDVETKVMEDDKKVTANQSEVDIALAQLREDALSMPDDAPSEYEEDVTDGDDISIIEDAITEDVEEEVTEDDGFSFLESLLGDE